MTLLWAADYSQANSNAADFQDADYNRQTPAGDGAASGLPWPVPISAAPDGVRSLQITLPTGGRRNEALPDHREMVAGDDMWFGLSFYLPTGFDTSARSGSDYQLVEQMRQASNAGSPVLAIEVRKGNLLLTGAYNATNQGSLYAYELVLVAGLAVGVRHYVSYRLGPFSTTPGASTADAFYNGEQVLSGYTVPPATLIGGSTYRKQGWYRDPANTYAGTIWHSDARTGSTFADVDSTPGEQAVPVSPAVARQGMFFY